MGGIVLATIIFLEIIAVKLTLNQCKIITVIKSSVVSTIVSASLVWCLLAYAELEQIYVEGNLSSEKIFFINLLVGLIVVSIKTCLEYQFLKKEIQHEKDIVVLLTCICAIMTVMGAFLERILNLIVT